MLYDFEEARFGLPTYEEDIQSYRYRAPEVLLRMKWDSKVDTWNIGAMVGFGASSRPNYIIPARGL